MLDWLRFSVDSPSVTPTFVSRFSALLGALLLLACLASVHAQPIEGEVQGSEWTYVLVDGRRHVQSGTAMHPFMPGVLILRPPHEGSMSALRTLISGRGHAVLDSIDTFLLIQLAPEEDEVDQLLA